MNKEEIEAIEVLESFEYREKTKQYNKLDLGDVRTSKVLLNLIDRLQKELDKKDKVIDLIAESWKQDDVRSVEEIKEYFYKKVEEENEKK